MKKNNILIVEESKHILNILTILINEYTQSNIIIATDYKKILDSYENDLYSHIIIEHNCHKSDELINYICSNNPQQKVILLSDSIDCPISCDTCLSTLKFVRLLKPINPKTIIEYLKPENEFICPNRYRFGSIDTIEKLFDFINLEENIHFIQKRVEEGILIIEKTTESNNIFVSEIVKIEKNVNKKFFDLEIIDNLIKIKKI